MGILYLHKFLERCSFKTHLSTMRGQIVGVDAMCWLHRGSVASAWELLTGRDTDKFLRFFVKMLVLCNTCGVKPIIVFDGASLPAKAKEETVRRERRRDSSLKAKQEIEARQISSFGQVDPKLRSMIVQSVSITPDMITRTMSVLRRLNVDFVVAPYEADAQLAYMYKQGIVTGVVSEDSDLIAFGCHRLLSKLDMNGDFVDVRLDWAFKGADSPGKPADLGELGKLERWTETMFVDLCIMSGSDYKLGKIAGIGIKKAFVLINRFRSIARIVDNLGREKRWTREEKEKFLWEFRSAKIAFQKHRVFNIKNSSCVCITDLQPEAPHRPQAVTGTVDGDDDIIGPEMDPVDVQRIMTGEIDAKTRSQRFFLDKLPPGVLGVYNSSLPQASDDRRPPAEAYATQDSGSKGLSAYELLEQELVAQFSMNKSVDSVEKIQQTQKSYLSKLESLILPSSFGAKRVVANTDLSGEEFANVDELLQLDDFEAEEKSEENFDSFFFTDASGPIDLDADESTAPTSPIPPTFGRDALQPIVPLSQTLKSKNPFAKILVEGADKRAKLVHTTTSTASAVPHLLHKPSVPMRRLTDSFVTSRDIVTSAASGGRKFFSRKS